MSEAPSSGGASAPGRAAGLFALSLAAVALQVVEARILSYSVNHAFVYLAIALAMLGFGTAGTWLALVPRLRRIDRRRGLVGCLLLFGATALGSNIVFARLSERVSPEGGLSLFGSGTLVLLVFAVPFFFAGLGTALALLDAGRRTGSLYAISLLGSAAGALVAAPLLEALGAPGAVVALVGFATLGGGVSVRGRAALPALGAGVLLLAGAGSADRVLDFRHDSSDQLARLLSAYRNSGGDPDRVERLASVWDPVGKIEIHRFPEPWGTFASRTPTLFYSQDAGAGSVLIGFGEEPATREILARGSLYGLATRVVPEAEVLVVGLGGGPDLQAALENGARRVVGVEINGAAVEQLERRRAFLGLPPETEGRLELVHADGRGHLRSSRQRFDVVQMTGADTYAASSHGGSVLSESYLYTVEAFRESLRALRPGGVLAITRFGEEATRVFTTLREALRLEGSEDPLAHLAVVAQGEGDHWRCVLCGREPLDAERIARIEEVCAEGAALGPECRLPLYDLIGFDFDTPMAFRWHAGSGLDADEAIRFSARTLDVSPTTDDRPYFFQFYRWEDADLLDFFGSRPINRHHAGLRDFLLVTLQIAGAALLLVLLPVPFLARRGVSAGRGLGAGLFFLGIGAGFMFLEIGLMQRAALLLGHPTAAIATVLGALLVATGLGSAIAGRLSTRPGLAIGLGLALLLLWLAGSALRGELWTEALMAGEPALRRVLAAVWIAPLGLGLGLFFPSGLALLERREPALLPWAFGANGFASVVAAMAAVPLSMAFGFAATFGVAAGAYLVAVLGLALAFRRG